MQNVNRNSSPPNEVSCDRSEEIDIKLDAIKGKERENAISDIVVTLDAREGEEIDNTLHVAKDSAIVRDSYERTAEALDLTGGKETDRNNDYVAVLRTPDSNPASSCTAPAASLLNRCCIHDSANKNNFSLEGNTIQLIDLGLVLINPQFLIKLLTSHFLQILHVNLLTDLRLAQSLCLTYPLGFL